MKAYDVCWEIPVYAESPEGAAKEALRIMQAKEHTMLFFEIKDTMTKMEYCVDLNDAPGDRTYCMNKKSLEKKLND